MSIISANTLFHFTREKDTLIKILQTKLYPRLCLEDNFIFSNKSHKIAYPMVCFCDLPLSQIKNHTNVYGRYAIGLKKEWAIKNGVTPILYTHKDSLITKNLRLNHDDCLEILDKYPKVAQISNLWNSLLYTSFFIKPYKGMQKISGEAKEITFYNEREWRYTLPREIFIGQIRKIVKDGFTNAFLSEAEYSNSVIRNFINDENTKYGLNFTPNDINYIIVEKEEEILELIDKVQRIKGRHPYEDVKLLSTRIISMERIAEDF